MEVIKKEIWDGYRKDGSLANRDLVRHVDGDYLLMQRDICKPNFGGYFETTAGGSALKSEDKITCAKRELFEETGITASSLEEIGMYISNDTIYYQFLCTTDCGKTEVSLVLLGEFQIKSFLRIAKIARIH